MRRGLLLAMLTTVSAVAHHNYGEYDRDAQVALEGTVKSVQWGNPHVLLTLQTENKVPCFSSRGRGSMRLRFKRAIM